MNPLQQQEGQFAGPRGISVFWQSWRSAAEPRGLVLLVHGLGEHSGRYDHVVQALVEDGFHVYALDHIGHGRSGGEREIIERFDDFLQPVQTLRGMMTEAHPGLPLFVLGHSMGGLISTHHVLAHPEGLAGLVLSGPALRVNPNLSPVTIWIGRILSVLSPKTGVRKVAPETVCRDPEVVKAYVADPLVFHGLTPARLAAELLGAIRALSDRRPEIKLPLMAMQGLEDRLVDTSGAAWLIAGASSQDKTLHEYPGLFHEVFNEPEKAQVIGDLREWLRARLPS